MRAAESSLLSRGIAWFDEWKTENSEGPSNASCHFEASDVAVDGGHIHQARYFTGPTPAELENLQRELEPGTALVCVHGFGAGVGIFYSALPAIRAAWSGPVFALDWFGCSLSSRPKWALGHGHAADPAEIERFFIHPLEQWRAITGLERMVIVGHSIGGYLAACYAEQFPEHVEQLILVSPAGVSGKADLKTSAGVGCKTKFKMTVASGLRNLISLVWNRAGINPLMVIWYLSRHTGPWPLKKWFSSFLSASWLEREKLVEYHYQSTLQTEVSGSHCLTGLLDGPRKIARHPLSRRLSCHSPVSFIYGSRDHLLDAGAPGLTTLTELTGKEPTIIRVAGAGHDMMVDNPVGFVEAVMALTAKRDITRKSFGEEALEREFSRGE